MILKLSDIALFETTNLENVIAISYNIYSYVTQRNPCLWLQSKP